MDIHHVAERFGRELNLVVCRSVFVTTNLIKPSNISGLHAFCKYTTELPNLNTQFLCLQDPRAGFRSEYTPFLCLQDPRAGHQSEYIPFLCPQDPRAGRRSEYTPLLCLQVPRAGQSTPHLSAYRVHPVTPSTRPESRLPVGVHPASLPKRSESRLPVRVHITHTCYSAIHVVMLFSYTCSMHKYMYFELEA